MLRVTSLAKLQLANVDSNLRAVVAEMGRNPNIPVVTLLDTNGTLKWWIFAHHMKWFFLERLEKILDALLLDKPSPFDPFWCWLKHNGIKLEQEDKLYLVQRITD